MSMCNWILKNIIGAFSRITHPVYSEAISLVESHLDVKKKNILDYLTPELLELIFSHLDAGSLFTCQETCKEFREIIFNSATLMMKIPMTLSDDNWKEQFPFIIDLGKYIRNVEVECGKDYIIIYRLLDFMPNLIKLKIIILDNFSLSDVRKLEEINQKFTKSINENKNSITDSKLKVLEFPFAEKFEPELFQKFLTISSLQKFTFRSLVDEEFESKTLTPFICQQNDLNFLELRVKQIDLVFTSDSIDKMKFKLKNLIVDQPNFNSYNCTLINQFLLKQKESLEELRIVSQSKSNDLNDILPKLKNLKKLTTYGLLSYFLTQDEGNSIYDRILLPNLMHLVFYREFEDFKKIDASFLPNLKSVNVKYSQFTRSREHEMGAEMSGNALQNLQHLKYFRCDNQGYIFISKLKSLNLESLTTSFGIEFHLNGCWTLISENLPNLHKLTIINIDDEKFFITIIKCIKNLLNHFKKDKLKLIKLHSNENDLELCLEEGKVVKSKGYCISEDSLLFLNQKQIEEKFKVYNLTLLTETEFNEKFIEFKRDDFILL